MSAQIRFKSGIFGMRTAFNGYYCHRIIDDTGCWWALIENSCIKDNLKRVQGPLMKYGKDTAVSVVQVSAYTC